MSSYQQYNVAVQRQAEEEARQRAEEARQRQLQEQEANAKALRVQREALHARLQQEHQRMQAEHQQRLAALQSADQQRRAQIEHDFQQEQTQIQSRYAAQIEAVDRQLSALDELQKAVSEMSGKQYQMYQVLTKTLKLEFSPRQIELSSDGTLKLRLEKLRRSERGAKSPDVVDIAVETGTETELQIHIQPGYGDEKECERFATTIKAGFTEHGFDAERTDSALTPGQVEKRVQNMNTATNRQSTR